MSLGKYNKYLTPDLILVLGVTFCVFLSVNLIKPILPLFIADKGINPKTIGYLFSVRMLAIGIGEILWGWIVDKIDLKLLLCSGMIIFGMAIGGLLIANSTFVLYVLFFLLGLFLAPVPIVSRWYLGINSPRHLKATYMALFVAIIYLTGGISGFASGLIAENLGYRNVVAISSILVIVFGFVFIVGFRNIRLSVKNPIPDIELNNNEGKRHTGLVVARSVIGLGLLALILFVCKSVVDTFLPLYSTYVYKTNSMEVGVLFGVSGIVSFLVAIPSGNLADKLGKRFMILLSLTIVGISMLGVAFSTNYVFLLASFTVFSLGATMFMPAGTALLSESVPIHRQGIAMGVYGLFEDVGGTIGPIVGGLLWSAWLPKSPFLVIGLVTLCTAIILSILSKTRSIE